MKMRSQFYSKYVITRNKKKRKAKELMFQSKIWHCKFVSFSLWQLNAIIYGHYILSHIHRFEFRETGILNGKMAVSTHNKLYTIPFTVGYKLFKVFNLQFTKVKTE